MPTPYIIGSSLWSALSDTRSSHMHALRKKKLNITKVKSTILESKSEVPYYSLLTQEQLNTPNRQKKIIHQLITQAISDAGLTEKDLETCHLFVGSTSFNMFETELNLKYANGKQDIDHNLTAHPFYMNKWGEEIIKDFNFGGNVYTFNTACTASANAFLYASQLIQDGVIDHAIVLGYEFFNEFSLLGFHSLGLISQNQYRPFCKQRDGVILGEGGGCIVLSGKKPDTSKAFYFQGGSCLCDTFNISTNNTDGSSIATVIQRALSSASLKPDDICLVKGHGTGSLTNDDAESNGTLTVFTDHIPHFTLLKPYIGHTLGACGIMEIILLMEMIKNEQIPKMPYESEHDELLHIYPNQQDLNIKEGNYLLNFFGFGGNNACIILSNT